MMSIAGGASADDRWLQSALAEARKGLAENEVPIGAILVMEGRPVGRAYNRVIGLSDPTAHAEILALREAARFTGNYRLPGSILYVTLEPCLMCAAALVQARVERLVYGAPSPKFGYSALVGTFFDLPGLNHRVQVQGGVMADECGEILKDFFAVKRGSLDTSG